MTKTGGIVGLSFTPNGIMTVSVLSCGEMSIVLGVTGSPTKDKPIQAGWTLFRLVLVAQGGLCVHDVHEVRDVHEALYDGFFRWLLRVAL